MAEELEGVYTTLHLKVAEQDFKKAQELMLKIADNKAVKDGFDKVEKGLGGISQTAEKQYKSLQGLNAITAKGFNELAKATDSLIGKIEELGKQSEKASKETKKSIKQAVEETKEQVDGIDNLIKKGAGVVGGYFAVDALKGYLGQAMAVRSQFQSIEYSMRILLGSEEKAKAMFEDIKKFAVDTPMDMKGIASAAQLMMGFGIDSGEVMKDLRALGDVAMGDAQRFQHLALAFAQMSAAGKLMGQDLLQMINAGFNPLQQMAIDTGKTIGELKAEMSAGLLTADKVKQAFWNAASEGGKYFGMMELQATTIKGQQEKLNDAMDAMYNEIASYLEDGIIKVLKFGGELIEHWKEVARFLGTLVTAYGAYRAAIMITTATQKAAAIAERALSMARKEATLQTKAATTAHVLYNQAANGIKGAFNMVKSMINPWTLLAVAIGAATAAIVHYATKETELEKAMKSQNNIYTEYLSNLKKEQREVDKLFGKLDSLQKGTKEYEKTKSRIQSEYGKYLKNLGDEVSALNDVEGAYKAITKAIKDKWRVQALDKSISQYYDESGANLSGHFNPLVDAIEKGEYDGREMQGIKNLSDREKFKIQQIASDYMTEYQNYLNTIMNQLEYDELQITEANVGDRMMQQGFKFNFGKYGITREKFDNYFYLEKHKYAHAPELNEMKKKEIALRRALQIQKNLLGNGLDIVLPEEEETEDKKPPKSTPITEDPNIKALNEGKKKAETKIKIVNQVLGLYGDLNKLYAELDAKLMDENDRNDAKLKAGEQTTWQIRDLFSQHPEFTDEEKRQMQQDIDAWFKEYGEYNYDQARAVLEQVNAEKAKLQKQFSELTAEKLSKKKGADNTDKVAKNAAAVKSLDDISKELTEVNAKAAILQNIVNQGVDNTRFEEKMQAFQQFAEEYSNMLANDKKELTQLQQDLDKASTTEEKDRIRKQIEKVSEENKFQLDNLMQEFELQYGNGNLPTDVIKFLGKYIADVMDWSVTKINAEILTKRKELKRLTDEAKKSGKDLSAEIAKIQGEIKGLESIKNMKLDIDDDDAQKVWDNTKKAVSQLTNAFKEFGSTVGGSTEYALNKLSTALNTSMALADSIVEFTKTCKDMINRTAEEGVTALKLIETSSVILEIISLVIQLGQAISNAFDDGYEKQFAKSLADLREDLRDFLHELDLNAKFDKNSNIFGTDYWGNFVTSIKVSQDALTKFNQTQKDTIKNADVLKQTGSGYEWEENEQLWNFWKGDYAPTYNGLYNNINDTVGNMKVKKRHKTWIRAEESDSLRNQVPELFDENGDLIYDALSEFINHNDVFDKLSGENQRCIKEMSKSWEEYKEYLQSVKDSMADMLGGIGNSIGDMFVNAFKTGESCLDEFEQSWDNAMENMLNAVMYNKFLQPIFDKATQELEDSGFYKNPNDEATMDNAMKILLQAKEDSLKTKEDWENFMKKAREDYGLYESNSQRSSLSGGLASVTQDTAEELNGRLTQIQSHTYSINEQMKSMHELSAAQLEILQGIKGDTARLESIETHIGKLSNTVSDIQLYGVKVK